MTNLAFYGQLGDQAHGGKVSCEGAPVCAHGDVRLCLLSITPGKHLKSVQFAFWRDFGFPLPYDDDKTLCGTHVVTSCYPFSREEPRLPNPKLD